MIAIALVDDEDLIRAGLRALLDAEPDLAVVAEETDGTGVIDMVRRHRPDVVLMDVRMPRLDGIEATRALGRSCDEPPAVLVLTTFENDDYVYGALRAGARGFLLKRSRPEQILDAVRLVVRGDSLLFPDAVRRLAVASGGGGADTGAARAIAELTDRESATLRLVARGMSNAEVAQELFVGVETVKTHVSAILAKLSVRDRTQAVVAAYDAGLIRPGEGAAPR